jgi:Glycosyltransferase family 87
VYPTFLADALLPFTLLSVPKALWAWRFFNLAGVVISAGFISRLLGYRLRSVPALLVLVGLFCFSPLWQALFYGQISILLLVLWSAGILLYAQGWKRTSALVLSVGALVKMTPLLIFVPILIWRDWRWIRWYAGGLLTGLLLMCLKNSPGTILFYFIKVIPPMSGGIVNRQNKTVPAAIGMLWCHGLIYRGMVVPPHVVLIGKLLCAALVGTAAFLVYRSSRGLEITGRVFVLAAFALLSLCVSPVSWVDALIIGYILLALLWRRMLAGEGSYAELLLLFATTVATGMSVAIGSSGSRKIDSFFFFQYTPLALSLLSVFFVLSRRTDLNSKDVAV